MISRISKFLLLFFPVFFLASQSHAADLLVLSEDVPAGLDYDGPSIAIPATQTGVDNLMEPLIYYKTKGMNDEGVITHDYSQFEGRLAESWSFDESTLTWTLKLRKNVKGCNGSVFNADDVIYTYERAKSVSGAAPIGWFLASVGSMANFTPAVFGEDKEAKKLGNEVTKVDDYTIKIRQSAKNALFLHVLTVFGSYIYDKETMLDNATAKDPYSHEYNDRKNAPSFSAYCLKKWVKDKDFVVTANNDYYRGKPYFDRVILRKVPQSANRLVILKSGQAQLVERLTPKEFDSLKSVKGIKVAGVFGNENLFIHMNYKSPPFDNPRLRRALAYAMPYESIIKDAYFNSARSWPGHVQTTYQDYHRPSQIYTEQLDKARSLLAEAGYPNGKGLDEFKDAFKLAYVAEKESFLGPVANLIKTNLGKIGINVLLDPLPQTQYGDRQLVKKDLPFALNDQEKPIAPDAIYAFLLFWVSSEKGGLNNMVNYSNSKVDELYAKALIEGDPAKRTKLAAEMQEIVQNDVAWIPVVEFKTHWAFNDKIKGIKWHPDNAIRWFDLKM
ncbi:MAG: Heme-binding protein A [Alphaproteobacteria bacterium MarineAlpha2_Bin1]|nr:MAG: Heme-binding protein A [Alphaproteobacteria bacterium MarineAlpha2_Bin1]